MPRPLLLLVRALVALTLAIAPVLLAGPAAAAPPSRLADQITDDVAALGAVDRQQVQGALQQLRDADGTQLFVVFVSDFDGLSGPDWASATGELSGLGTRDVLLAVAVDTGDYGTDVATSFRLDDAELADLLASYVEPELADGDWGGAAVAAAEGLQPPSPPWAAIGIGAVVLLAGAGGYVLVQRRRAAAAAAERIRAAGPYPEVATAELTAQASEGLLAVDEAVRSSQLDLDFARLQYGESMVGPFAATLAQARGELQQAFTLRQQLDDELPEDEPTTRRMLATLLELVQAADDQLAAQAAEFAALRDLEANAPQLLDGLAPRVVALTGRLPGEEQRLEQVLRRWAPAAVAPVEQAVPEARAQIAAADQAVIAGRVEVAAGRNGAAVPCIRTAEAAVAVAQTTLDSIGARARELETAAAAVPAARAEVQAGIDAAQAVGTDDESAVTGPLDQARQALAVADQLMGGPPPDPVTALARLDAADDALDVALAGVQHAATVRRDAAVRAERAVTAARGAVVSAAAAVASSREVAGAAPRTRLSEAERHLAAAEVALADDPATAATEAARANSLAHAVQTYLADRRRDRAATSRGSGGSFFGGSVIGWSAGRSYRSSGRSSSRRSSSRSRSSSGRRSSGRSSRRSSGGRRSGGGRF